VLFLQDSGCGDATVGCRGGEGRGLSKGQQVVVVFGPRTDSGARPPPVKRHDDKEKEVLADAVAVFICGPCCGCGRAAVFLGEEQNDDGDWRCVSSRVTTPRHSQETKEGPG